MYKANCPAKINLYLKLIGIRPDGYRDLESLFAFLDLYDVLEVEKSDNFQLEILGEFANSIDPNNNLFTKIWQFFVEEFSIDKAIKIKITKNIPVGAGLGGGSSNAAFFIKALNQIFSLNLSKEKMQEISLNFGSDIAFFFEGQASIIRGRGEIIENFPHFKPIKALLVNPKINLSTKDVFGKFTHYSSTTTNNEELKKTDILQIIANFSNDLTSPAIALCESVQIILSELKNCDAKIAKMSGSGASCFAIFSDEAKLENAHKNLQKKFPNFLIEKVNILSSV